MDIVNSVLLVIDHGATSLFLFFTALFRNITGNRWYEKDYHGVIDTLILGTMGSWRIMKSSRSPTFYWPCLSSCWLSKDYGIMRNPLLDSSRLDSVKTFLWIPRNCYHSSTCGAFCWRTQRHACTSKWSSGSLHPYHLYIGSLLKFGWMVSPSLLPNSNNGLLKVYYLIMSFMVLLV